MDSRSRIDKTLRCGRLDPDERLVLEEILRAGYGANGSPLGRAGALSAAELARKVFGPPMRPGDQDTMKRAVRRVVNSLIIRHKIPICCEPGFGGGYYLPADDSEVEANHHRFHRRAMTGLMKATRAKSSAYADSLIQLSFGYDGPEGREIRERYELPEPNPEGPPLWVSVVTKFLDRLKNDPDRYARELRQLQDRYGELMVPRRRVRQLKSLAGALKNVVERLEG